MDTGDTEMLPTHWILGQHDRKGNVISVTLSLPGMVIQVNPKPQSDKVYVYVTAERFPEIVKDERFRSSPVIEHPFEVRYLQDVEFRLDVGDEIAGAKELYDICKNVVRRLIVDNWKDILEHVFSSSRVEVLDKNFKNKYGEGERRLNIMDEGGVRISIRGGRDESRVIHQPYWEWWDLVEFKDISSGRVGNVRVVLSQRVLLDLKVDLSGVSLDDWEGLVNVWVGKVSEVYGRLASSGVEPFSGFKKLMSSIGVLTKGGETEETLKWWFVGGIQQVFRQLLSKDSKRLGLDSLKEKFGMWRVYDVLWMALNDLLETVDVVVGDERLEMVRFNADGTHSAFDDFTVWKDFPYSFYKESLHKYIKSGDGLSLASVVILTLTTFTEMGDYFVLGAPDYEEKKRILLTLLNAYMKIRDRGRGESEVSG